MRSVLLSTLLLLSASAQASFLCQSQERREDGRPVWAMHVHELEVSTHADITIWKTGQEEPPAQFGCTRESTDYEGGRTSEYKCQQVANMALKVFAQTTGDKIKASVDLRADKEQIVLTNMSCK